MVDLEELKLEQGFLMLYGLTIYTFQQEERMKYAKSLLRTTAQPLGDIALAIGFKNLANFSKAFKNKFGYTPSAYRHSDVL